VTLFDPSAEVIKGTGSLNLQLEKHPAPDLTAAALCVLSLLALRVL